LLRRQAAQCLINKTLLGFRKLSLHTSLFRRVIVGTNERFGSFRED